VDGELLRGSWAYIADALGEGAIDLELQSFLHCTSERRQVVRILCPNPLQDVQKAIVAEQVAAFLAADKVSIFKGAKTKRLND
jgi:hypothetical protein